MHFKKAMGILSQKNGMNISRGCTHGCIYCDSRSKCYSMEHDFEDVEVKENAVLLLEKALRSRRKKCMIETGAMTDPYIPLELEFNMTKRCLEIIERYGFGLSIQTKSDRILRDIEILKRINEKSKCVVQMTMTTFDDELCKLVEPNVCVTSKRFEVLIKMKKEGIPTIVWIDPFLPFINDTEENLRGILRYCIESGVKGIICFNFGLTLREGNREYFYEQLDKLLPGIKEKYQKIYGDRYEIVSKNNIKLRKILVEECAKHNIVCDNKKVFDYIYKFEEKEEQLNLFNI